MQTRAAVLRQSPGEWEIHTVELDPPKAHEVLVRLVASGLCHSDDHFATGDIPPGHLPFCGGHEGAGVVEAVGPGVTAVAVGDHIVTSFMPSCGRCRWCASGLQTLCDNGKALATGQPLEIAALYQKRIQGSICGMMNPHADVPRLLTLWQTGQLKLEELITRTYPLDEINQGYADMRAGLNLRGVLRLGEPPAVAGSGVRAVEVHA